MISIIVPVYNVEKYVAEAIESVKAQTHEDWELLLINDGSTDLSGEICRKYSAQDIRIKYFEIANSGACAARNIGLENVRGSYIMFLDADDILPKNSLEILMNEMLITDFRFDIVYGSFSSIHQNGKPYRAKSRTVNEEIYDNEVLLKEMLMYRERVSPWGRIFKKELLTDIIFRVGLPKANDLEFQTRLFLTKKCKIKSINENVYIYRLRNDSLSHKGGDSIEKQTALINAFCDIFHNYPHLVEKMCKSELAHNILLNILWLFNVQKGKRIVTAFQRKKIQEYLPYCSEIDDWVTSQCKFIHENEDEIVNKEITKRYRRAEFKEKIRSIGRKLLR